MERKILQPEQIIVPWEYKLANESILKIYYRIFDKGHDRDLPPAIVAHKDTADMFLDVTKLDREYMFYESAKLVYKNYNKILQNAFNSGAEYFLLDGNHRTVAATLTHKPFSALELQVNEDIKKGKQMFKSGYLFDWTIPGETLDETMSELRDYLKVYVRDFVEGIHVTMTILDSFPLTLKKRVDLLIHNGDLPQYMQKAYLDRK